MTFFQEHGVTVDDTGFHYGSTFFAAKEMHSYGLRGDGSGPLPSRKLTRVLINGRDVLTAPDEETAARIISAIRQCIEVRTI